MNFNYKELRLIPNVLSIFRLVLVIPIVYFILNGIEEHRNLILVLLFVMYVTDISDGFIARKFNMVSETGKIIDPIADKIAVAAIFISLFIYDMIPVWFFCIVIFRDILILIFGYFVGKKKDIIMISNFMGKITVFGIGLVILLTILKMELLTPYIRFLYYIVTILIVYSSILYFFRYKKTIGEH
ncbi:MAG: CDP-alcohol phosphatidyltransferase family protein [Ignavibacteria bacterium]|nr:CDP-diacylglycerol--glycerol-3-phosphate 3-phosphatidyltransferase [Ignavibacteria bacterium]MCC6884923.1 CDP-alcohol phosphatidyltransferase family protein [Ignavibacteriales bacterium]